MDQAFLLMVDTVNSVCSLQDHQIYLIENTSYIPFTVNNYLIFKDIEHLAISKHKDKLAKRAQSLRKLLFQGFYFSFTRDLTLNE